MRELYAAVTESITASRAAGESHVMKDFHYHKCYELYYLVKGKRNYIIDEDYYSIGKGDMVLIKPEVLHRTAGGAYERVVINFTKEYLENFFTSEAVSILLECYDDTVISIPVDYQPKLNDLFEKIITTIANEEEELTFVYLTEIFNTIFHIRRQKSAKKEEILCEDDIAAKILHYINSNYSDIENISQIADEFFITKNHLCRIFKKVLNTSVVEYLNRVKIKRACSLLESTDMKIVEIANACGFNSSVYFGKIFKKLLKMTAVQYRKLYKNSIKK